MKQNAFQLYGRKFHVSNATIYKKDKTGRIWRRCGNCLGTVESAKAEVKQLVAEGVIKLRD